MKVENTVSLSPGSYREKINAALSEISRERIIERIWERDYTVWKREPKEITNRLGWLTSADAMRNSSTRLRQLADSVRSSGYTHALLCGMGGSSLAPEVFRTTFGVADGYLDLAVLDSTVPAAVRFQADRLDPARTLFVIATKSGTTVETLSFFKFFYNRVVESVGAEGAGARFAAITDPGSVLADTAKRLGFNFILLNDPNIGGRFSALSYFGLMPAALIGMDVPRLLERARAAASACAISDRVRGNPAAVLGVVLGEMAKGGRDKLTIIASPRIASFGNWVEQLVAESTGKEGRGILPVVGEPIAPPAVYGDDRLFVYLRLLGDGAYDEEVRLLEDAGFPVLRLPVHDPYDIGGQFFIWETAVSVAGARLGINPFNQPNVEATKEQTRRVVKAYASTGRLPREDPLLVEDGISVYYTPPASAPAAPPWKDLAEALSSFLAFAGHASYVALQAYLPPTRATSEALQAIRIAIRDRTRMATTTGYGPRFLHSTGQLHKGDSGRGLFIQLTADDPYDVPIPDEAGHSRSSLSFGALTAAEAIGDRRALIKEGRQVIRFHLGENAPGGLKKLIGCIGVTYLGKGQ